MKILFLGYSKILRKRILQAVKNINGLNYEIASVRTTINKNKKILYQNYTQAIKSSNAEIVYVSLKNKYHFKYAKVALMHNKHVIVDKPIVLNLKEIKSLIKISKLKKKLLAESLVFQYHQQYKILKKNFRDLNNTDLIMHFNIPAQKKINYFNKFENKDDCLFDMLPYAAYVILDFLKDPLITSITKKVEKKKCNEFFNF